MNGFLRNFIRNQAIDPERMKAAVRKERAERSLSVFIRQAWSVIEPNTPYVHNWHIDLIAEYLQAVNDGEIHRLLINITVNNLGYIFTER